MMPPIYRLFRSTAPNAWILTNVQIKMADAINAAKIQSVPSAVSAMTVFEIGRSPTPPPIDPLETGLVAMVTTVATIWAMLIPYIDVDECARFRSPCQAGEFCLNTYGSYICLQNGTRSLQRTLNVANILA